MNLEWVIIGGGIHGVHIAARLLGQAKVEPEKIRIVDPGDRLLQKWRSCTQTTGMKYLRSPAVHQLDLSPWSLDRFAGHPKTRKPDLFAPPYDRPKLTLFNDHCDQVIETYNLQALHIKARATGCSVSCDSVRLSLSNDTDISAENVVLAIGMSEQPEWPSWAPKNDERIQHIFAKDFDGWPSVHHSVAVVGGGISAGQIALRLMHEGHDVHLISRHALREHQFDSDPGWLGPRFMKGFMNESDVSKRRELIRIARHKGSVPPDVQEALESAICRNELKWHEGEVEKLDLDSSDGIQLLLASGPLLKVQRVLLATGFAAHRPGGSLVDDLVEEASLPCASCGYPIVDQSLRWHPRVFVSGPLAELELGPSSRNISGARRAGDRLVEAALAEESLPEARA